MTIYREKRRKNFTILPNDLIQNEKLSYSARGLLEFMLSLPEDWGFNVAYLVKKSPNEGETKIRNYLKEIKKAGYIRIVPAKRKGGRFNGNDWIVADTPRFSPHGDLPDAVPPQADTPDVDSSDVVNQALQRTIKQRTINNKELKEEIYSSGSKQPEPRTSQSNEKPKKKDKYTQLYKDVISYLNHKTGTHYRATSKATQKLIRARAEEGYTLEDFKRVIDNKAFSWQHSDMWKYMRPQTLFSPKFESYLNENDLRQTERQQPQSMGYEELDEYSSNDSFFSSDNQPPEPQLPPDDDLPF